MQLRGEWGIHTRREIDDWPINAMTNQSLIDKVVTIKFHKNFKKNYQ